MPIACRPQPSQLCSQLCHVLSTCAHLWSVGRSVVIGAA